jgi:DNA repair protein RecN (Recombination protein N)
MCADWKSVILLLIMLSRLSIQNYAIIEQLEVNFSSCLNVITGETGAGKSIIVGALGLILGQRAESNVLFKKDRKCIVEGCFKDEGNDEAINEFLKNNELDLMDELTIRREIAPNGKSRAFINDTPVNLTQLNSLSSLLVDLHQQFDTLSLGQADFQREVLDALGGNHSNLKRYFLLFDELQEAKKALAVLKEQKLQFEKEADYNQYQFDELEDAAFSENELEDLEQELKILTSAEGIKNALTKSYFLLEESEEPVTRQLKNIIAQLQPFASLHADLNDLIQRLNSAQLELQDIAAEVDRINNHIGADLGSIDQMNERLSAGYRLLKKHGVKTTNELLSIKQELSEKLQAVLNIDEAIGAHETACAASLKRTEELANTISEKRKAQVKPLETQVNKMLVQVGMPAARLKVEVRKTAINRYGLDEVVFLFDANKSNQFQPLRKVASGGELSRLMLCIKSLVARSMNLPTLIFDEIDTGISGEAAKQVGGIMKELAANRQVICITHQPQIAGKGDSHLLVYKSMNKDIVTTAIRLLNKEERVVAIAKMLSGEKPTAAALENAREMVMN